MTDRAFYVIISTDQIDITHVTGGIGTRESYQSKLDEVLEQGLSLVLAEYGLSRKQDRIVHEVTESIQDQPYKLVKDQVSGLRKSLTEGATQ